MTYRSLEDALISPIRIGRLPHLGIRRLRVDNTILPRNLFPVPLLVADLLLPVLLQLLGKTALQLPDLRVLDGVVLIAYRIRLEEFDLVLDRRVEHLRLRDHRLELRR